MAAGIGLLTGCKDDFTMDDPSQNPGADLLRTKLRATIYMKDYELQEPATRFSTDPDDNWSIGGSSVTFTDQDTVGIFTRWGNLNLPTKDGRGGPLINIPMYFVKQEYQKDPNDPSAGVVTAYTLENEEIEIYPPGMRSGQGVLMYYPYTPDMGSLANYPNWKEYVELQDYRTGSMYWGTGYTNSTTTQFPNLQGTANDIFPDIKGLELRVKGPDGKARCRDMVQMREANLGDLTKGIISGAVYHCFSELLITRGPGFENPKRKDENGNLVDDETIVVVLDQPISHIRIISYSNFVRWTTQLFYQDGYTFNGETIDEEEAKKWYAWEGAMYPNDNKTPEDERKRAWYVLVPTNLHLNNSESWKNHTNRIYNSQYSYRPTITEIQLYDNDGILQHVTSFTLKTSDSASPTKQPYPTYRWPIEVAMDELGPTVRPVTLENWDENRPDKDITDERTAGIHSMLEFNSWVARYNEFIEDNRQDSSGLEEYGDRIDGVWHFYFSGFDFTDVTNFPQVNDLQDIVEGNNQFFNVMWSNLNLAAPMFDKITGNGGIKNIDFDNITLNYTQNTEAVGLFAKEISTSYSIGGSEQIFENCNVNGAVLSQGPVGLLAGQINFGRISNCKFEGRLRGSTTSQPTNNNPGKLFGVDPSTQLNIVNTTCTNIMFTPQPQP